MKTILYQDNSSHGEDAYLRGRKLFVVLDGVSTSDGKLATKTVLDNLRKARRTKNGIKQALIQAHETLLGKNALTTVVGALRRKKHWWVFGIGDSPIYDAAGARLLPIDSVSGEPAILTQAIGDGQIKIHETTTNTEKLFLMTDGISDNIAIEELLPVKNKKQMQKLVNQYKSENKGRAYGDWKEDDQTILVIHS